MSRHLSGWNLMPSELGTTLPIGWNQMQTAAFTLLIGWNLLGLAMVGNAQRDCANVFTREYNGTQSEACPKDSFTGGGCFECIPWANVTDQKYGPKDMSDTEVFALQNYCRYVADKPGPTCYIHTPDGQVHFDYCRVPPCHAHSGCMNGNGSEYRDQARYTESGYECLPWSQMLDQDVNPTSFPDAGLDENFCRNPNNDSRPWCYYRDDDMQIRTDFCPIDTCKDDVLSKFVRHYKTYIPASNRKYYRGWWWDMTAEDCARFCLEEQTFTCRSFEYREEYYFDDRRCILSDQSLHTLDIYHSLSSGTAIDLFTRIDTVCDAYQANGIPDHCPLQLGMEDGRIPDSYITASSFANSEHQPGQARLNGPSHWKPAPNTTDHWLQVCFPDRMLLSGVIMQGGGLGIHAGWVENFCLEYSLEGTVWWKYRNYEEFNREPQISVFRANGETTCARPIILPVPVRAKCIRVVPTVWNVALHIRMDLIGCRDNDCDTVLGVSDGRVLDSHLSSSSSISELNSAETARLNPLNQQPSTGWVPRTSDHSQWFLVDLKRSHVVRAVLTQGCGNMELWVTSYRMFYSNQDGDFADFEPYTDENGLVKDYMANFDQHSIVRNDLNPEIVTRFIRIDPIMWHPAGMCLRFELIGCLYRVCGRRLGMESGAIPNSRVSASSFFTSLTPPRARLHYESGTQPLSQRYSCWGPRHELGLDEWLQADLGDLHTITGVITQGAGDPWRYYWVQQYKLQWLSANGEGYKTYKNLQGTDMIFSGNFDQDSEVRNNLDRPFITRHVRIVPYAWHNITACLRVEFIGCPLEGIGNVCGTLELAGYCMGSVDSQAPTACHEIFSEGSHSLIIHSSRLQRQLWENRHELLLENQHKYLIGLALHHSLGQHSYRWVDGTPMTFSNIQRPLTTYNRSIDYCISMNSEDLFHWTEEACVDDIAGKAQICQIDIDECISLDHSCSHECVNVPGSYYCRCPSGFRLNETDLRTCIDICDWETNSLIGIHYESDEMTSCYGRSSHEANWTVASAMCSDVNSRLPSFNDAVFSWASTSWNDSLLWADPGEDISATSAECLAVRFDNGSVFTENVTCSDQLPFVCLREYEDITCNALWVANTSSVATTSIEGFIQSLSYAPWYDTGSTCTIHIRGPTDYKLRLVISRMALRKEIPQNSEISTCVDALEVTDNIPDYGLRSRGRYCGTLRDLEVVTQSNDVTITLTIGELNAEMPTELGFVARYILVNCSEEDCQTDCETFTTPLVSTEGTLETKNFPAKLSPFSTCVWHIKVPDGQFINLTFSDFRVVKDAGSGQCADSVVIARREREGEMTLDGVVPLESLCGTAPSQILSESSELIIFYKTGLDVPSEGFRAVYSTTDLAGCGVGLNTTSDIHECTAPAALLTSLNYPLPYHMGREGEYRWRITTTPGTFVQLTFDAFDIPSMTPCDQDKVEILDGIDEDSSEPLGEFCNPHPPPDVIRASTHKMLVIFEVEGSVTGNGFSATYRAVRYKPQVSLSSPYDEDYSCENEWAEYYGHCYRFHKENTTLRWKDAERNCRIEGALLTSIRDYGEMSFIHLMLTSIWYTEDTQTYIGLMDIREEGHFRWLDGRPLSYADWLVDSDGNTQPDGGLLEDCSVIIMQSLHSTQNWNDIPCSLPAAKQFICKKPAKKSDGTEFTILQTIGELQTKECNESYSLAGSICARHVPTQNGFRDPTETPDCDTDIQVTPELLVSILYLLSHVWTTTTLQQEGALVGVGPAGGMMRDRCEGVRFTDGEWVPGGLIACHSPVTATVCYQQPTDVTQQCTDGMFHCGSGECIHKVYVCNDMMDCKDSSDEATCTEDTSSNCDAGFFPCRKGGCVSVSFLCDFINQCLDGSDEEECVYPACSESEFTCSNKECIPEHAQCNLHLDCADGSDEINCDTCTSAYQCYDSSCIPHHAVCDATQDCPGFIREDEAECDLQCSENQLQCNNGACTNMSHWCMYDFDEFGYQTGCRDVTHLRFCEDFTCSNFTYKCPRSYCIPLHRRCDNVTDCPNGEDELSCDTFVCPDGAYKCHNCCVCVTSEQVCNGIKECTQGDDELFCDVHCPVGCLCTGLSFTCNNTHWDRTTAVSLPDSLRSLVVRNAITTTRQRRQVLTPSVTLEDVLCLRLERFQFLYELDISGNMVEVLEPGMFSGQRNLYSLSVSNNRLHSLEAGTFEGLQRLQKLDLSGNPLVRIQPGAFQHLQSLPNLDLHGLKLGVMHSESFVGLDSLLQLNISNNNVSKMEAGTFKELTLTTVLDMSGNNLKKYPPDLFSDLPLLQTLHSDEYLFCCMVGAIQECTPEADQFSSCEDLMRNHVLRAFIWILGLSAFLGNIFVVVWRLRTKQRFKVQGLLILNLALADCLMGVYMLMIAGADAYYRNVYIYHADNWKGGVTCTIAGFLSAFSSEASVFTLTFVTLDRFLCIMFPFRNLRLGRKSVKWAIAGIWILSFILSVFPALGLPYFGEQYYGRSGVCLALPLTSERTPGWEYSIVLFLGVNLASIITILVCYTAIYVYAKRSAKQIRSTKGAKSELKLATRTFLIIATDMCCWFPIVIMGFLALSGSVVIPPAVYAWTAVFILPINSSINPYLYTISSIGLPKILEVSAIRSQRCHCQDAGRNSEVPLASLRSNGDAQTMTTPATSPLTRRKAPSVGRFLLSVLLSENDDPLPCLHSDDLRSIKCDLETAIATLHARNISLSGNIEDAVILEKQPSETVWHASLLLPRTPQSDVSKTLEDDTLQDDTNKLEKLMTRLKNELGQSTSATLRPDNRST